MVDYIEMAKETLSIEKSALEFGMKNLGQSFAEAVELIRKISPPGRVVMLGMGKSGHIAKKIAATMASTGTPSVFVHPAEAGHGDLGMISRGDVVIAISQSGNADEILRLLSYFKRNSISLIAMTGNPESNLAKFSDLIISTEVPREACPLGLAPTASSTLALALGDALAMCLLKCRGFTKDDFASTHPHGSLGRKLLLCVKDVMKEFKDSPTTDKNISIREALNIMSKGGLGFLIRISANKQPLGVYTDGDLRRTIDADIDIKKAFIDDNMIRSFASISSEELAVKALEIMEVKKISSLPVVDTEGLLIGAINMRLLLQAGIV